MDRDLILSFCTWSSNNDFLFTLPWDQINKNTIARYITSITCISRPINIWISNDISVASITKCKPFSRWSFDLFTDSNNCIPMVVTRRVQELTYYTDWKRYIGSSQGKIMQLSYKSLISTRINIWLPLIRKKFYIRIHKSVNRFAIYKTCFF